MVLDDYLTHKLEEAMQEIVIDHYWAKDVNHNLGPSLDPFTPLDVLSFQLQITCDSL